MPFEKLKSIAASVRFNLTVHSLNDRVYLRETMLPAMAALNPANVLLAGTRRYTKRYPSYFRGEFTNVWTIDFDPDAARFGNGDRHRTGDIRDVDEVFSDLQFEMIHANGLIGFGIDSREDTRLMLEACHRALVPEGYLMLGWDADLSDEPSKIPGVEKLFRSAAPTGLPERHRVIGLEGYEHVFDWLQKR